VEGSEVVHLSVTGSEVATDVAVTPDEQRLLGVGTLIRSPGGLNPRMSKEEKRIVGVSPLPPISCRVCLNSNPVYNIKEQVVEK
jgi:hypothetical protein